MPRLLSYRQSSQKSKLVFEPEGTPVQQSLCYFRSGFKVTPKSPLEPRYD